MENTNKIPFPTRLGYRLMYGVCWLAGLLPMWFLYYPLADFIYFVLYKLARYRVAVVRENLANSFPEKSEKERRGIERKFYHNLAEYFVDAIDIASATPKDLLKRCQWPDENRARVVEQLAGRNWVTLLAHFGSWELMSTFGFYRDASAMVSAYRPIKNRALDLYYIKSRNHLPRVNSVPDNEILRFYVSNQKGIDGSSLCVALIADQNPHIDSQTWWVKFLNQPSAFFHGGEKIARKFGLPVYFMHTKKVRRGHWEQTFELIWDGVSPIADRQITNTYAAMLEAEIREHPELWLWSHRRWKHMPWDERLEEYNARYGTGSPR